jgi:hypothetical protein
MRGRPGLIDWFFVTRPDRVTPGLCPIQKLEMGTNLIFTYAIRMIMTNHLNPTWLQRLRMHGHKTGVCLLN